MSLGHQLPLELERLPSIQPVLQGFLRPEESKRKRAPQRCHWLQWLVWPGLQRPATLLELAGQELCAGDFVETLGLVLLQSWLLLIDPIQG